MKKLFVCAMALAAFVSCSKDDVQGPEMGSGNKTVSIAIKNSAVGTRAALDGTSAGVTAPGIGEVIDGKQTNQVAQASQLFVLFADGDNIMKILPLAAGSSDDQHTGIEDPTVPAGQYVAGETKTETVEDQSVLVYTWHNVPWAVDNIAVVRTDATKDATYYGVNATVKSVEAFKELAKNEPANLDRELSEIVLFGQAPLVDTNETHEVNGITYHYYRADVKVAPQFARFEINNIECEDLGNYNPYVAANDGAYSFDELDVLNLQWTSSKKNTYQIDVTAPAIIGTLYGTYVPEGDVYADPNRFTGDNESRKAGNEDDIQAGANKEVWSWNVLPTYWTGMTVGLTAYAYDYALAEGDADKGIESGRDLTLNVVGLNGTAGDYEFKAGEIYKLNLTFKEKDVRDEDQLCVEVTVDIAEWTVVDDLEAVFSK